MKTYLRFITWIVGIVFFANVAIGIWIGVGVSNESKSSQPSTGFCIQYPALC